MLFRPFRFGIWARLAVIAVATGELVTGGAGSSGFNLPSQQGGKRWPEGLLAQAGWGQFHEYLPWIALGVVASGALLLLWIYVESVYRFILFDAVLSDQCRLRMGWRRWRECGRRYFLWVLGFSAAALAGLAVVIGVPVYLVWRAGWFHEADRHFGALFGGGVLVFLVVLALVLAIAVTELLARDFLLPVMVLEDVGALAGWERLLPMLRAEKGAFAGYVLMKIVLAVGSAILFGIVNVFAILALLIPLGILGVVAYLIAHAAGLSWSVSTVLFAVALGLLALAAVFYVIGFVYAPGLVFFQSYTLQFLGSRYAPLGSRLLPAAEPPSAGETPPPAEPLPA